MESKFKVGDQVVILEGELKHTHGEVISVGRDTQGCPYYSISYIPKGSKTGKPSVMTGYTSHSLAFY